MNHRNSAKLMPWLFLTPALLLFLLIYAYPLATVFLTSFTDWEFLDKPSFIGFRNYIEFFSDSDSLPAFINTVIWVLLQSTVHVGFGLIIALFISRKPFYWKFARTVVMLPNIISISALGLVMLLIFHPSIGPVNGLIRLTIDPEFSRNWFFTPNTAFLTVTFTWLFYAGVIIILLLTELAAIPDAVYESALIEGASWFKRTLYITVPLLRNMLGTCVLLAATSRLTDFAMILLTTQGGPGVMTTSMPLLLYRKISIHHDWGSANAIGTMIILFGLALIALINRIFRLGSKDY